MAIRTPRTLVVVTPTFHPEPIGTPLYATDLVRWFSKRGWNVQVVTAQPFYPKFERYDGYDRSRRHDVVDGVPVLRLPTIVPKAGKSVWRAVNDLNFAVQGIARAARHRADAVLTITPGVPWAALVGRSLRRRGGRHVVLVHDIQSGIAGALQMGSVRLGPLMRASERASLNRCERVFALTDEMAAALRGIGVSRELDVLPLWATVSTDDALLDSHPATATVQYSGNFGAKQGVGSLLDLAEALATAAPEVRLVLRGAGWRFDEIRKDARRRQLGNVSFEAPVSEHELPDALASAPVHVVMQTTGSASYAMPSKVVNALACGAQVVALTEHRSPLTRLADVVDGLEVVTNGEMETMAKVIAELLRDPALERRRREVRAAAVARFSRDDVLERLESVLAGQIPAPGSFRTA